MFEAKHVIGIGVCPLPLGITSKSVDEHLQILCGTNTWDIGVEKSPDSWNRFAQKESSQFKNNYFAEMCSSSEEGSYSRLIDFCITQL